MSQPNYFQGSVPLNYEKYSGPAILEPFALDITERLKNENLKDVLELACGTGRVTRHLINNIPASGQLIATDISADMLTAAQTIVKDERINWQIVDAMDLPFDNESFDHVVCQFGLMFFPDKSKAVAEVYRVLQGGGKFIFNVWDSVENNPRSVIMKKVLLEFFDDVPEEMFLLPHSLHDKKYLQQLMQETGFTDITIEQVTKVTQQSPDIIAAGFSNGALVSRFLATKPEAEKEKMLERLKDEMKNAFGKDGMKFPIRALVVGGVK